MLTAEVRLFDRESRWVQEKSRRMDSPAASVFKGFRQPQSRCRTLKAIAVVDSIA